MFLKKNVTQMSQEKVYKFDKCMTSDIGKTGFLLV